ncbi:Beta-galactosidase [Diplonema papillatum]|nr:Beta-galactosidase [Diplonema papillatum]|eukprot:gene9590-14888_t
MYVLLMAAAIGDTCQCGPFQYPRPQVNITLQSATPPKFGLLGLESKTTPYPCPLVSAEGAKMDKDAPRPAFPRPQMVRPGGRWANLNGPWRFGAAPANADNGSSPPADLPSEADLNLTITVPFPPEACLSGVWINALGDHNIPNGPDAWTTSLWYRKTIPAGIFTPSMGSSAILHFEAVDWKAWVYVNRTLVGTHEGGYTSFSFDITSFVVPGEDVEVTVYVYDPTDYGRQVFGKQRITALLSSGGVTYTPSSGIWDTVWVEFVPEAHILDVVSTVSPAGAVALSAATTAAAPEEVAYEVFAPNGTSIGTVRGASNATVHFTPAPGDRYSWSPDTPFLYNFTVSTPTDTVVSYFGLRVFANEKSSSGLVQPILNGEYTFALGWLDQSFWSDGLYAAPTDAALKNEILYNKNLGFNLIRLHQKVNPKLWYHWADVVGVMIFQDMPQHYTDAHGITPSVDLYEADLREMMTRRMSSPSIVQWIIFNEADMIAHFNVSHELSLAQSLDSTRIIDAASGSPGQSLDLGNVSDVHHYPWPLPANVSSIQYNMAGEWGGIGYWMIDHLYLSDGCFSVTPVPTPEAGVAAYSTALANFLPLTVNISSSIITGSTDVERECDGFLTYDRVHKYNSTLTQQIAQVNAKFRAAAEQLGSQ